MSDSVLERLAAAVGDRYSVEGEVGHGGMAMVFLATDLRHGRQVAIKVLRPELSAALGEERFHREIEVAATLTHPNILPLYDSGEADGLLYYVMPYIEGESVADRLNQETHFALEDAVRITQQVARALHYAHQRGVVHRDIKPDNILLVEDQALVADFGIARVAGSLEAEKLTTTGLAVGTPHYMSPEQASPDQNLDGRADIYSLGCVLYEMIAGQPPFLGKTVQAVLARHAVDRVPSLRTVRQTVTPGLERVVEKSIAKVPADRYRTAEELAGALERERAAAGSGWAFGEALRWRSWEGRRARRALAVAVALAVVVIAAVTTLRSRSASTPGDMALDPDLIAVAPFRVTSSGDLSFGDFEDGIPELMYLRLAGESGPRTVYPGTAGPVWERLRGDGELTDSVAFRGARELGAGRLMLGHVLVTGGEIVLNASLFDVLDGSSVARAEDVRGPVDDLLPLLDHLVVELLIRSAGESEQRLSSFVASELSAVRAYLAGQAAFHESRFVEAVDHYIRALDTDSTFAIAGLQLAVANSYAVVAGAGVRGLNTAWAHRDRLTSRDQLFLDALGGPAWPEFPAMSEQLEAWQAAAEVMPDRKTVQFLLADYLYHYGASVGLGAPLTRAEAAFRRVLALDEDHRPAQAHLFELAALTGDTAAANGYAAAYLSDSTRDYIPYYRWRLAQVRGDRGYLASFEDSIPWIDVGSLERVLRSGQMDGAGIDAAVLAAHALVERGSDLHSVYAELHHLALNRGRPSEALEARRMSRSLESGRYDPLKDVFDAIYWGGDLATAAQVADERGYVDDALAPRDPPDPLSPLYVDNCTVGLWRVFRSEFDRLSRVIEALRDGARRATSAWSVFPLLCAEIIDAELASATRRPDARTSLARLDSLSRLQLPVVWELKAAATLSAAKLLERQGDLVGALDAIGRRPYGLDEAKLGISTFLREEGRLALLAGDREKAIRAFRFYLNLRSDPEPPHVPEAEHVREQLDQLLNR